MGIARNRALKVGFLGFSILAGLVFVASYVGMRTPGLAGGGVGLVRVEGPIMDARTTVKQLREYAENPQVKALVLRVDSPGGAVAPSQEIHNAVQAFRDSGRPVITSMGALAASGGYYIAAPSTRIFANPGTLTGSIGVIMSLANVEGLLGKLGVTNVTIKAGKNKDVGSPFRPMTEAERALLTAVMDDIHDQFIEAVASGRDQPAETIRPLADGRVFTGRQAMAVGLVDEMGDLEAAIRYAGKMVGIAGRPHVLEHKPSPLEKFLGGAKGLLPWRPLAQFGPWSGPGPMYLWTL